MDYLKHGRLTSSSAARKNTQRVMECHLHAPSLPGVQAQSAVFLKAGYRFTNDRREVAREQVPLRSGGTSHHLVEIVRDGLFQHGGAQSLVAISSGDDCVLAERSVH